MIIIYKISCPNCNGLGYINFWGYVVGKNKTKCPECNGKGKVQRRVRGELVRVAKETDNKKEGEE